MKGTLKIQGTFQGTFSSDSVVQVIILVHSLKKGNTELMAKVNLGQIRPSHMSESYTSQLYRNAQVNQDMKILFVWIHSHKKRTMMDYSCDYDKVKKELFQRIE